ncbi:MAG: hypothetical protein JW779_12215 [Candidatus Thorarchaeota archaeon]|nr:hypothetical protein [Candidatus Thorarchaeota archaeon]
MRVERAILLEGLWGSEDVRIEAVPLTFQPTSIAREIVKEEWERKPIDAQDLPLWRYEGYIVQQDRLVLQVSLCTYRWHFVLRHQNYKTQGDYPNPLSATTLIHTQDNKIILGIRKGSDQGNTLHAVGGGFIDPLPGPEGTYIPENPFDTSAREITEETSLKQRDFSKESFSMLGIAWGSNHDTTCVMHAPVDVLSEDIDIGAPEHAELVKVGIESSSIRQVLSKGHISGREGTPATDHLILALELLIANRRERENNDPNH